MSSYLSGWFSSAPTEGADGAEVDPSKLFHEFPHPEDWRTIAETLLERFGEDGDEIPRAMCPLGDKRATARRFLVARKYSIDDAESALREAIAWRKNVKVGDRVGVEAILSGEPRWDLLAENRKIMTGTPFLCHTKQGFPVYLLRIGKGDAALATTASEETHIYSTIVRGEHLVNVLIPEATKRSKKLVADGVEQEAASVDYDGLIDKQVVIIDLEGVGMSALRCLFVLKTINSVASKNYPELSKAIYVVNAPSAFDYLWSAVKPLLAAHTQHKIKIYSQPEEQYAALQKLLEDADIPDFLVPAGRAAGAKDTVTTTDGFLPETVKAVDEWLKGLGGEETIEEEKTGEEVSATIEKMSTISIQEDYAAAEAEA
ncbi:CRAL/TRIO, N-terminal domain [Ostreococcus tauri]|uniref:CRAL/TRIO, N-terminal domain n=1 Tax=Ostreococcus tauri TaxID=70448 RepID=Q01GI6_OSTTA|nr:CRAL/TRIO, N-terminal domain [Ostreococcus tauri]CAL50158.1 CRAL/TRIO, N-terminal domain [Ostreococcus tauri]|eukprot:XP_003074307.1 CRAL/TRIO, N-terminal domain [Ostreococcus tauri]